jgi:aspartate/methionine/tyrosine aminotransferase
MQLPQRFADLPEYAFPRLRRLLADCAPGGPEIAMSIGEPRHPLPAFVTDVIAAHGDEFRRYPPNEGAPELRAAIAAWLARRYGVQADPDREILPLNGTREGLFNAALALSPDRRGSARPAILLPNPFYQCYGAAALAVGAEPVAVAAREESGFLPDYAALPRDVLERTTLCYICSPSNPQGAVADAGYWRGLIDLAERYDFRILADECYGEIYRETAPVGALEVARGAHVDPERVLVFHSLSKRSNAPGLRSGFVAGGAEAIAAMTRLRAYGGAPLPLPLQRAATALWQNEAHVVESRDLYRQKYAIADRELGEMDGYTRPEAGFFLWLRVGDGEAAARRLFRETGVKVLPGAYLGRPGRDGRNPGTDFIRVAMVADPAEVTRGLTAIRNVLGDGAITEKVF